MEMLSSNGYKFLIDDDDFDRVSKIKWCWKASRTHGYLYNSTLKCCLHNFIMGGKGVGHINHDTTDNRKSNLRLTSQSNNLANQRKRRGLSSKYKGVSWRKSHKKFVASICKQGRNTFLGYFDNEQEAALAYDQAAKELFGEFAYTNSQMYPQDFKHCL